MLTDRHTRQALQRLGMISSEASARAWAEIEDPVAVRQAASNARRRVLDELPDFLRQLEKTAQKNGTLVYWADSVQEANRLVVEIQRGSGIPEAMRNHALLLDEIDLDRAASANNIRIIRLHPGDQILDLTDSDSSHPIWPTAHLRVEEISAATQARWRVPITYDPDILASTIRMPLRRSLLRSYTAIVGLNFAVAETGNLVFLDNDGHNASMVAFARHLICLMSIEQVVANTEDLHTLIGAFSRSAWGRPLATYVTQVCKPTLPGIDGPREIHLIIVDNNRSRVLKTDFGEILKCIHCGACINICPVYPFVGSEGYGESTYQGPVGAVLNPLLFRPGLADDQPYLSTGCDACHPVCPVDIDLPALLHKQRERLAPTSASWLEQSIFRVWQALLTHPRLFRLGLRLAHSVNRIRR